MSRKKKIFLTIGAIILLPVLWWFVFGAGIPVVKHLLGFHRHHDVIIGGTPEEMYKWKQENLKENIND